MCVSVCMFMHMHACILSLYFLFYLLIFCFVVCLYLNLYYIIYYYNATVSLNSIIKTYVPFLKILFFPPFSLALFLLSTPTPIPFSRLSGLFLALYNARSLECLNSSLQTFVIQLCIFIIYVL